MNCFEQVQFLHRVTTDAAVTDGVAILTAAALVTFVNRETGRCYPSIGTLGERMRRKEEAVRRGLQVLEAAGHIDIVRRFNDTNEYVLKLKPVAEAPAKTAPIPHEKPVASPSKIPGLTGSQNQPLPEPGEPPVDTVEKVTQREVMWLVRRWQQLADKPGWKMANALAAVIGAIRRAGFGAVAHLFAQFQDEGKRPAWWLERQLRDLRPISAPTLAPVEASGSAMADASQLDTLPVEALARIRDARLIVDDARINPPLWRRVYAAIEAIGMAPFQMSEPHLVEKQLALALARGQAV